MDPVPKHFSENLQKLALKINDSMVHVDFESEDGKYLQHLIKLDFSLLQSNWTNI